MENRKGGVNRTLALNCLFFCCYSRSWRRFGDGEWRRLADDGAGWPELPGNRPGHQRGPRAVRPEALQPGRGSAARTALSGVPAPPTAALVPGQHAGVPAEVSTLWVPWVLWGFGGPALLVHKLHARTAVGGEPAAFGRHSHVLAQLIALCIIMQRPERFVATLRKYKALLSLIKNI